MLQLCHNWKTGGYCEERIITTEILRGNKSAKHSFAIHRHCIQKVPNPEKVFAVWKIKIILLSLSKSMLENSKVCRANIFGKAARSD